MTVSPRLLPCVSYDRFRWLESLYGSHSDPLQVQSRVVYELFADHRLNLDESTELSDYASFQRISHELWSFRRQEDSRMTRSAHFVWDGQSTWVTTNEKVLFTAGDAKTTLVSPTGFDQVRCPKRAERRKQYLYIQSPSEPRFRSLLTFCRSRCRSRKPGTGRRRMISARMTTPETVPHTPGAGV